MDKQTRLNKIQKRIKCGKFTEEQCKAFHQKNECCYAQDQFLQELDQISAEAEEDKLQEGLKAKNEVCCRDFTSDFCSRLESYRIYNVTCCINDTVSLIPPVIEEL